MIMITIFQPLTVGMVLINSSFSSFFCTLKKLVYEQRPIRTGKLAYIKETMEGTLKKIPVRHLSIRTMSNGAINRNEAIEADGWIKKKRT
ncbi:hypothetical protein [Bacillus smithii]|uniref:hypothetical protein n=1 Tax=Bacillus smithii TaxID=1479 RepID=UPI003D25769D